MKPQYKVEAFTYYSKVVAGKDHIRDASKKEIQEMIDKYANEGWRLISTDATSFGAAVYIYLYFQKG